MTADRHLQSAKDAALAYLSHADRTVRQVRDKLAQKEFAADVVDRAVAALERSRLLDDRAYARRWIESRMTSKPAGEIRLVQDLLRRGVERETIDEVLAEFDDAIGSEASALKVLRQQQWRYTGLEADKARRRMYGLLGRRGFDIDTSAKAVDRVLAETVAEQGS